MTRSPARPSSASSSRRLCGATATSPRWPARTRPRPARRGSPRYGARSSAAWTSPNPPGTRPRGRYAHQRRVRGQPPGDASLLSTAVLDRSPRARIRYPSKTSGAPLTSPRAHAAVRDPGAGRGPRRRATDAARGPAPGGPARVLARACQPRRLHRSADRGAVACAERDGRDKAGAGGGRAVATRNRPARRTRERAHGFGRLQPAAGPRDSSTPRFSRRCCATG
jgi:hypothetical protein